MKTYLCAFAMCQSMFCAIPFPGRLWDEKARGKMLLFLPVVGLEIGLVWAALAWAVRFLKLPALVGGLALCACPFLLTGSIHLDGFMDVTDAVKFVNREEDMGIEGLRKSKMSYYPLRLVKKYRIIEND